jgi:antitoxin MazE
VKVSIIPIGNSRGVRLPKAVLEQLGFGAEAELLIEGGRLTLTPVSAPRRG